MSHRRRNPAYHRKLKTTVMMPSHQTGEAVFNQQRQCGCVKLWFGLPLSSFKTKSINMTEQSLTSFHTWWGSDRRLLYWTNMSAQIIDLIQLSPRYTRDWCTCMIINPCGSAEPWEHNKRLQHQPWHMSKKQCFIVLLGKILVQQLQSWTARKDKQL